MFLKLFFILNSESSLSSVFCLLPSDLLFLISEFSLFSFVALHLSRALYKITPFMQNKPNFRKPKMNISNYIEKTYENQTLGRSGKNKPNQTQFFKHSYQRILFHTKNLKRTKSRKIREKKLNQTQFRTRAFLTQSLQLLYPFRTISTISHQLQNPFRYHFAPFQTTFITTYISTTYKKTLKKNLVFRPKTHVWTTTT